MLDDNATSGGSDTARPSQQTIPTGALPRPLTSFVGRGVDVDTLTLLLRQPATRLVTLTGPGGVGKTRLALQVASTSSAHFDSVTLVPLASIRDPRHVLPAVAAALDVRSTPPDLDAIARAVASRSILLVLDNLEQVAAAPQIAALLYTCPGVRALATSREIVRVSGEIEFPVLPFETPDLGDPGASDALQLFVERARAVRPNLLLDRDSEALISAICRRLDGLPLAIELAAARLRHLSLPALLDRLDRRLPLLTGGAHDQPARLRALRDTVAWSYDLLDREEQRFFRALSVFSEGFSLPAAASVAGRDELHALDLVSGLVDKSLLRPDDGPDSVPRFRMLETIREFALEQLEASGEGEHTRVAHARWFASLAQSAIPSSSTGYAQAIWLARLDLDLANFRSANVWLVESHDVAGALRLAGGLPFYWYYRGHLEEARQALETALTSTIGRPVDPRDRAWAMTGLGLIVSVQGDHGAAIQHLTAALATWGLDDRGWGSAMARSLLGGVHVGQGRYDEAEPLFEEALNRFAALGNPAWIAHARFHLGVIAAARGENLSARTQLETAATLYDEIGTRIDAIDPIRYLGLLACREGDLTSAAEHFRDNLIRLRERGSPAAISTGLTDVATFAAATGDHNVAARLFAWAQSTLRAHRASLSLPARDWYDAARAATERSLGDAEHRQALDEANGTSLAVALALAERTLSSPQATPETGTSLTVETSTVGLTARELEILRLLVEGRTNAEIADALFISAGTVRNHVSNVLAKLDASTRTEAAHIARRLNLI